MENDTYKDGYCKRCGRKRTECQKIIDSGKRCTDKPAANACTSCGGTRGHIGQCASDARYGN